MSFSSAGLGFERPPLEYCCPDCSCENLVVTRVIAPVVSCEQSRQWVSVLVLAGAWVQRWSARVRESTLKIGWEELSKVYVIATQAGLSDLSGS